MKRIKVNWFNILTRRFFIIPVYYFLFAITLALSPLLLVFALVWDLFHENHFALTRSFCFLCLYLASETLVIALAFLTWVFSGKMFGLGQKRFLKWSFFLQRLWGCMLFNGTFKIFGMRMDIDEPEGISEGPLMFFGRHVAMPDTSIPGALTVLRHNIRLRHIAKKELLWDPVLSILGHRLPHYFVDRSAQNTETEVENIRKLASDMGPKDGIMIFPEGTRFTPKKRKRIIEKLAAKGDEFFLEKARALKNVLPPRLGGSLAILEANTQKAYAVFCAHVGFDAANKALDMLNGSLIHRTIRVKLWKVPFDRIPKTREEQIEWLYEHWMMIDEWIEHMKNRGMVATARP